MGGESAPALTPRPPPPQQQLLQRRHSGAGIHGPGKTAPPPPPPQQPPPPRRHEVLRDVSMCGGTCPLVTVGSYAADVSRLFVEEGDAALAEEMRGRGALAADETLARRRLVRARRLRVVGGGSGGGLVPRPPGAVAAAEVSAAEACVRSGVQDAEARGRVLLLLATLRDAEAGSSVGGGGGGRSLRPPGAGERLAAARRAAAAEEDAVREEAAGRSAVSVAATEGFLRVAFLAGVSLRHLGPEGRGRRAAETACVEEREAECRGFLAGLQETSAGQLRAEARRARRVCAAAALPLTHPMLVHHAVQRQLVEEDGCAAVREIVAAMRTERAVWVLACEAAEHGARRAAEEEEAGVRPVPPERPAWQVAEAAERAASGGGVVAERLAEAAALEECYRVVHADAEAAARRALSYSEMLAGERAERGAARAAGTRPAGAAAAPMPEPLARLCAQQMLERQNLEGAAELDATSLVAQAMCAKRAVRARRVVAAERLAAAAAAAAAPAGERGGAGAGEGEGTLRKAAGEQGAAERLAVFEAAAEEGLAELLVDFTRVSAAEVEEEAVVCGLTHNWDHLLRFAYNARTLLEASCRQILSDEVSSLARQHLNPKPLLSDEQQTQQQPSHAASIPPHLLSVYEDGCRTADARRAAFHTTCLALLRDCVAGAARLCADAVADVRADACKWAAAAPAASNTTSHPLHSSCTAAAADMCRWMARRREEEIAGVVVVMKAVCGGEAAVSAATTAHLELAQCARDQAAVAAVACTAEALGAALAAGRPALRAAHARCAVLAGDSTRRLRAALDEDAAAAAPPVAAWLAEGERLCDAADAAAPNPLASGRRRHQLRCAAAAGDYLLRRAAATAARAAAGAVEEAAGATRAALEEGLRRAVHAPLDCASGLRRAVAAGERANRLAAGEDVGGQELARLQVAKGALAGVCALVEEEEAARRGTLEAATRPSETVAALARWVCGGGAAETDGVCAQLGLAGARLPAALLSAATEHSPFLARVAPSRRRRLAARIKVGRDELMAGRPLRRWRSGDDSVGGAGGAPPSPPTKAAAALRAVPLWVTATSLLDDGEGSYTGLYLPCGGAAGVYRKVGSRKVLARVCVEGPPPPPPALACLAGALDLDARDGGEARGVRALLRAAAAALPPPPPPSSSPLPPPQPARRRSSAAATLAMLADAAGGREEVAAAAAAAAAEEEEEKEGLPLLDLLKTTVDAGGGDEGDDGFYDDAEEQEDEAEECGSTAGPAGSAWVLLSSRSGSGGGVDARVAAAKECAARSFALQGVKLQPACVWCNGRPAYASDVCSVAADVGGAAVRSASCSVYHDGCAWVARWRRSAGTAPPGAPALAGVPQDLRAPCALPAAHDVAWTPVEAAADAAPPPSFRLPLSVKTGGGAAGAAAAVSALDGQRRVHGGCVPDGGSGGAAVHEGHCEPVFEVARSRSLFGGWRAGGGVCAAAEGTALVTVRVLEYGGGGEGVLDTPFCALGLQEDGRVVLRDPATGELFADSATAAVELE